MQGFNIMAKNYDCLKFWFNFGQNVQNRRPNYTSDKIILNLGLTKVMYGKNKYSLA